MARGFKIGRIAGSAGRLCGAAGILQQAIAGQPEIDPERIGLKGMGVDVVRACCPHQPAPLPVD